VAIPKTALKILNWLEADIFQWEEFLNQQEIINRKK